MSLPIVLLSGADGDLQDIFNRFEEYQEGFGDEFIVAVDAYLTRIGQFPEIAPVYLERIRRQVLQKYPFGIFYQPEPSRVLVFAVLDLRQDERNIVKRLKG